MNPARAVLWAVGIVFVLAGAYMLYYEAGLDRWVSIGILGAGFLLFIGLAIMGFSAGAPSERPSTVVNDTRVVRESDEPRTTRIVEEHRVH